jgi:predicted neutral ceramidase superfamily lipid hydrolase
VVLLQLEQAHLQPQYFYKFYLLLLVLQPITTVLKYLIAALALFISFINILIKQNYKPNIRKEDRKK